MEESGDSGFALTIVLVIALILIVGPYLQNFWDRRQYLVRNAHSVPSRVDGEHYRVHLSHNDPKEAADMLAVLHKRTILLLRHLRNKYLCTQKPGVPCRSSYNLNNAPERIQIVRNLLERYDPDQLAESSPLNPLEDTSYTLNKGELLALCLREKDSTKSGSSDVYDIHDQQILWFVTVHELGHLGVNPVGHPPEFWNCFKFLLAESTEAGLDYDGWPDYSAEPVNYCGLVVNYNPLYDSQTTMPV